jgi:hypothetical protein
MMLAYNNGNIVTMIKMSILSYKVTMNSFSC